MASYKYPTLALCCLALLSGIAATSVRSADDCPDICPALYSPVCATDGNLFKEFSNSCMLHSMNCRRGRNAIQTYAETDPAWCSSELVDNLHEKLGSFKMDVAACMKPCAMIYQPICVTNGKYRAVMSNSCALEHFNCALQESGSTELLRLLSPESC